MNYENKEKIKRSINTRIYYSSRFKSKLIITVHLEQLHLYRSFEPIPVKLFPDPLQ